MRVMDGMGVFSQLAHHSISAMKHGGNVLSSVSLSPMLFLYLLSHSTFPSIISHFPLHPFFFFASSLWPNYFSLCFAPPALCVSLVLYIVQHNFPSSFPITSCISFLPLPSAHVHTHSPRCMERLVLGTLPVCF